MDKAKAIKIQKDLTEMVTKYCDGVGLEVSHSRGKFGATDMDLRFSLSEKNEGGVTRTKEYNDFVHYASLDALGYLKPDDIEKVVKTHRGDCQVVGYLTRGRKRPILMRSVDGGQLYKFPIGMVEQALGRKQSGL